MVDREIFTAGFLERPTSLSNVPWRGTRGGESSIDSCRFARLASRPIFECRNHHLGGGFKYFYFNPYLGKWSNLTNVFQMAWNHQLDHDKNCHVFVGLTCWRHFSLPLCENKSSRKSGFSATTKHETNTSSWLQSKVSWKIPDPNHRIHIIYVSDPMFFHKLQSRIRPEGRGGSGFVGDKHMKCWVKYCWWVQKSQGQPPGMVLKHRK